MALLTTVNMSSINQESSTITKDLSTATINGIDLETVEQDILLKDRAETIATAAKVTFSQDVLLPNNEITIQGNIIDKNIIDAPKMRNNFCCTKLSYPLCLIFVYILYIGSWHLFSIAPRIIINLATIA